MYERRSFTLLEIRAKADKLGITGHAAVFNQLSDDLGGFKEMIRPGAFASSIARDDIRSLWNHDANFVLGRNKNGSLVLSEDDIGLAIDNTFPDTTYARDLAKVIERGDVDQMSFGFRTLREDWRIESGLVVRELIEAELFDVSPVTFPAYPQTDVSSREARSFYSGKMESLQQQSSKESFNRLEILRRRLELSARV